MSQEELDNLANEIEGTTLIDPDFELKLIEDELTVLNNALQKTIVMSRVYKFLLDEKQLLACQQDAKRFRNCIRYFEARKTVIENA